MRLKYTLILILSALSIGFGTISCTNSAGGDFEQLCNIEKFPIEQKIDVLNATQNLDIEGTNITDIRIADSLLIVSVAEDFGFWHVYSLPQITKIGSTLNVGVGAGDLPTRMQSTEASFNVNDAGHIIATIPVSTNSKYVITDLTEIGDSISTYDQIDGSLMPNCIADYRLKNGASLRYCINPENPGIKRVIVKNGKERENEAMMILNSKSVTDMSELSRLITYTAIQPNGTKVAEVSEYAASINIWDTANDDATSLIMSNIENTDDAIANRIADNKPLYSGCIGYDKFFIAQRIDYNTHNKPQSASVEFFGWNGKALGCLTFNSTDVKRVDIDIHSGDMYILTSTQVRCVNIGDFLLKILD
jgi:hypothetical protein